MDSKHNFHCREPIHVEVVDYPKDPSLTGCVIHLGNNLAVHMPTIGSAVDLGETIRRLALDLMMRRADKNLSDHIDQQMIDQTLERR